MLARRLAIILAVAAYVVPWVPRLIRSPRVRYNDYGAGAGCALLAVGLLGAAFVLALFGSRVANRKAYWTNVTAVGLFWFLSVIFVPV